MSSFVLCESILYILIYSSLYIHSIYRSFLSIYFILIIFLFILFLILFLFKLGSHLFYPFSYSLFLFLILSILILYFTFYILPSYPTYPSYPFIYFSPYPLRLFYPIYPACFSTCLSYCLSSYIHNSLLTFLPPTALLPVHTYISYRLPLPLYAAAVHCLAICRSAFPCRYCWHNSTSKTINLPVGRP